MIEKKRRLAGRAIRNICIDSIREFHIVDLLTKLKHLDNQLHEIKFQPSEINEGWKLDGCV